MPPPFLVLFLVLFLLLPTLVLNTISTPLPFSSIHSVTLDVHRNISAAQRRLLSSPSSSCLTGNPIDDCWRCDPNWPSNRHRLADCGVGFGREALGGKHGHPYLVTDSSDSNPANPKPGTLRYAVVQEDPLWITFSSSMTIHLSAELLINSFKTLDARGSSVHLTGKGCVTLQYVSNVILHGLHIHHCSPSPPRKLVMSTPTHVGLRSPSDGDAISIYSSRKIWIDHCSLSYCSDGLVDAVMGSTAITVSNCHFSHHNDVMLLGHSDGYRPDKAMQVTIAFNVFGAALVQRMPRCRHGYFHVVNNDYRGWEMYAIGGSAAPTVNSQGNRYRAPENPNAKEVTKRVDSDEGAWGRWDWRSVGDEMVNGAVFIASGEGAGIRYDKASSVEPKSAGMLDRITANAGVIGDSFREDESGGTYSSGGSTNGYEGNGRHSSSSSSSSSSSGGGGGNRAEGSAFSGYLGMIYAGRNGLASSASSSQVSDFFYSFAGLVTLFMFSSCGDLWRF